MKLRINSCDGRHSSSLDVRFTKACDNDCSFCIEKGGIDSLGATDVNALIESTTSSGKREVLILGGEPFLQVSKLLQYVEGIRAFVDKVFITTSLPKTLDVNNPKVQDILLLIDGLNVSLQHYDPVENNRILIARSEHNRIDQLSDILDWVEPEKVRVSINLVKGSIDTKAKLITCLNVLQRIGATHVKINELQHSDLWISFEELWGKKFGSPYATGCQKEIKIMSGMNIILKRSCFLVEDKLSPTLPDLCKAVVKRVFLKVGDDSSMVLYENGRLETGWIKVDKECKY